MCYEKNRTFLFVVDSHGVVYSNRISCLTGLYLQCRSKWAELCGEGSRGRSGKRAKIQCTLSCWIRWICGCEVLSQLKCCLFVSSIDSDFMSIDISRIGYSLCISAGWALEGWFVWLLSTWSGPPCGLERLVLPIEYDKFDIHFSHKQNCLSNWIHSNDRTKLSLLCSFSLSSRWASPASAQAYLAWKWRHCRPNLVYLPHPSNDYCSRSTSWWNSQISHMDIHRCF